MLSEFQQGELWRNWISGEIRADYFADMGRRYTQLHSWLTWLTLFFSAGTVAAIIGEPGWLKIVQALITTALSLTSLIMQNPKKAAECADLHLKWNRLAAEYQALWSNVYLDDADSKFASLVEKEAELSKASMAIPNKPKIVEKWEEHVLSHRTASA
jgi:hypothetical protein